MRLRTILWMRWSRNDGRKSGSMSSGLKTKWLGKPRQKAVSRLLESLLEQHWLTSVLEVQPALIGHT